MSTPQSSDEFVVVGRLGGAHGIKGWLKVTSFTDPRNNLLDYSPWYLKSGSDWQERDVLAARQQGKGLVVHLDRIHDREQALTLRGVDVAIHRSQLPRLESDEYYWTDLIGLKVVTTDNVRLGQIAEMMATGANDVMVIQDDDQTRLVPFVQPQFVKKVDLEAGSITVDWDPDF